jgi:hypothetical protein
MLLRTKIGKDDVESNGSELRAVLYDLLGPNS